MKKIVLIGAGHSHLETITGLGKTLSDRCEITLISNENSVPYSGMIPGLISGHYTFRDCHINLSELCNRYNVRLISSSASRISVPKQLIDTPDDCHKFDIASINIGSVTNIQSMTGSNEMVLPVKPIKSFIDGIESFLMTVGKAPAKAKHQVSVVGGGAASIEISLALKYRTEKSGYNNLNFSLITASDEILETHSVAVRRKFRRILHQQGISTQYNKPIVHVGYDHMRAASDEIIKSDLTIWATGAGATNWPKLSNLPTTKDGFIKTDPSLKVKGTDNIFAVGDIGSIEGLTYPKSGVYAIRQAATLASNIKNLLNGSPLDDYQPQKHSLALISAGNKYAVAGRNTFYACGKWVWYWKHYIDRKHMEKYRD